MDKLRLQTVNAEFDASLARGGKDPFIVVKAPSASKGGVAETSIKESIYHKLDKFYLVYNIIVWIRYWNNAGFVFPFLSGMHRVFRRILQRHLQKFPI